MKAALLTALRQFAVKDIPGPSRIDANEVLIRIKMVGVCGSDIHYFNEGRIGDQQVRFPFIVGHEAAGFVEETGRNVKHVKPGQRVAIDPAVFCGRCEQCRAGRPHTCRQLLFLGCPGQLSGALCEYIVLPEICCFPVRETTTFEQAVLSEPLAIALYAVRRAALPKQAAVAVLGAGPIGISVLHALQTVPVKNIYVTDKIRQRLDIAAKMPVRWSGNPDRQDIAKEISSRESSLMDVVFECSGNPLAYQDAWKILKPGGTFVIIGIPAVDSIVLPVHELRRREITLVNIRRQNQCTAPTITLIENRQINPDNMVTHYFPLEEIQQAFELVAAYRDGVMKAMITID